MVELKAINQKLELLIANSDRGRGTSGGGGNDDDGDMRRLVGELQQELGGSLR